MWHEKIIVTTLIGDNDHEIVSQKDIPNGFMFCSAMLEVRKKLQGRNRVRIDLFVHAIF